MKTPIEKLQDQRRELSIVLANIIDRAVPVEGNKNHVVPSYLIKDANKAYNKIWRKS
jgi:hypothetical protein